MIISIKISGPERNRGGSFNYKRNRDTARERGEENKGLEGRRARVVKGQIR